MAQPNVVPHRFMRLSWLRIGASAFFLATAIQTGKLADHIKHGLRMSIRNDLGLSSRNEMMLSGSLIIQSCACVTAFIWAWFNILGEATQPSRWTCLRYSLITDLVVVAVSVISVALQRVAVQGSVCQASDRDLSLQVSDEKRDWCPKFENRFRLTIAVLALLLVPIFFTLRFLYKKRLSEARADADDWTKGRSTRSKPLLQLLQVAAAPFRFFWRCLCKTAHASTNPLEWFSLLAICILPILVYWSFLVIGKTMKNAGRASKTFSSQLRGYRHSRSLKKTDEGGEPQVATVDKKVVTTDISAVSPTMDSPATNNLADHIELKAIEYEPAAPPPTISLTRRPQPIPATSRISDTRKSKTKQFTNPGSTTLERILEHPTLFFELISQLHGADFRALYNTSNAIHRTMRRQLSERPRTVQTYLCSRFPGYVRSLDDDLHIQDADISNPAYTSKPCWACGVKLCNYCSYQRTNLRVSKTELRLRMLQPVCSTCYFHCLCQPTYIADVEDPSRPEATHDQSPRTTNTKIFHSLSAKCNCISQHPLHDNAIPRGPKSVCRDCRNLGHQALWRRRLKRGAIAEDEDLPTTLKRTGNGANGVTLAAGVSAASAGLAPAQTDGNADDADADAVLRGPRGQSAIHTRTCHGCKEDLWWWRGKNTGLRWWRCRKCGLEARDVLMSASREFQ